MRKNFLDFVKEKNDKAFLSESFREKDVEKAISLIDNILRKHINGNLLSLPGFVDTVIDDNKYTSKQYIVHQNDDSLFFQFNWLNSEKSANVYSIDFFDSPDIYWSGKGKSTLSIYTLGTNIVRFLPIVWEIANTRNFSLEEGDAKKLSSKIFTNTNESFFNVDGIKYIIYDNLNKELIDLAFVAETNIDDLKRKKAEEISDAEKSNENPELIRLLKKEYNEICKAIDSGADNVLDVKLAIERGKNVKIEYSKENDGFKQRKDPEQIFKEMGKYIALVIKGLQPSLILCGAPGVGKTFRVKKQLKENGYSEGDNLCTIKGKCTARKLYLALYEYRDKNDIILIDDADSLVGPKADENCINILKAALDSSTDPEGRLVTYGIAGKLVDDDGNEVPKKCYVKSGVIVITNYRAGALDTALRNRSFMQDIDFSNSEILSIIEKLLPSIEPSILDAKSKLKAFDYLEELNKKGSNMELSLRTFVLCAKIFKACDGDSDFNDEDAKSMIEEQMALQFARGSHKY